MKSKGLTINQRNLYFYFLSHNTPCKVPQSPLQNSRLPDYLKALHSLEERGLIKINKESGPDYRSWVATLLN